MRPYMSVRLKLAQRITHSPPPPCVVYNYPPVSPRACTRLAINKSSAKEKEIPKSSRPVPFPSQLQPQLTPTRAQSTTSSRSHLDCRFYPEFLDCFYFLVHLRRESGIGLAGMRLHGEGSDDEVEKAVMAPETLLPPPNGAAVAAAVAAPRLVVGYALTKKKVKSFLQPKLLLLARKKGISFISIDETRPLSEQGPFDIILHKITTKEWQQDLEDYHEAHPEVTVLDPPNAIGHLNNRQSMLEEVADLNLSNFYGEVCTPRQLVIMKDPSSIPTAVAMAGLTLPLVAKPLVVDATFKSHELSLAYDEASLSMLDPPLVLQEFVNHGGILFKVYIIGETIQVARRFSLPDVNSYDLLNNVGIYRLPRVSCAAASADHADLDPHISELPPRPLLEKLGRELRGRLGLTLFNIDMIRELGTNDRYYIIDINYFPGYGKMQGYEHIFTDFLLSLAQSKYKKCLNGS